MSTAGDRSESLVATIDSQTVIDPMIRGQHDWVCEGIRLIGDRELKVSFLRICTSDWLEVRVVTLDAATHGFRRLQHCGFRYKCEIAEPTAAVRAQVGAIVRGLASAIDARLSASGCDNLADALGRTLEPGQVTFGRELLRALLAPEISEGVVFGDGWTLADVYPTAYVRRVADDTLSLIAELQHIASGARLLMKVERRRRDTPAFARTSHFDITFRSVGEEPQSAVSVRALAAFLLQLRDHDALEVNFPNVMTDVGTVHLLEANQPNTTGVDQWLNLSILTDCGQKCVFCSSKDLTPPDAQNDIVFARCRLDIAAARQRGITQIRVNGYDPLAHPRIVDIIRCATDSGFERMLVLSPCTKLSDLSFCRSVVEAMPLESAFNFPLYAAEGALHDEIVGVPGAYDTLQRALDNVIALRGPKAVQLETVVMKQNYCAIPSLVDFAAQKGLSLSCHLVFPILESHSDNYFSTAARQDDVARAIMPSYVAPISWRGTVVRGIAPCVMFRAFVEARAPIGYWINRRADFGLLPGTEYRSSDYVHGAGDLAASANASATVKCPHAPACVLLSVCGGELLRGYVELFGLDEFQSVGLVELIEAS